MRLLGSCRRGDRTDDLGDQIGNDVMVGAAPRRPQAERHRRVEVAAGDVADDVFRQAATATSDGAGSRKTGTSSSRQAASQTISSSMISAKGASR